MVGVGAGVGLRKKRRREEKKGEGIEEKGRELLLFLTSPPPPPPPHFPLGHLHGRLIEVTTIEEPSLGRPKSGRDRLIEVAA